mmetsp:Transcript_33304/g.81086  ORF Transcript_33304/g.81086 Transcript_33304/m.81086 type:complete len:236 (+) Transcript_33304:1217-1924(+)
MPRKHHRAGWLRRAPRLRVRAGVQRHQRRGVRHVPRRAVQDVQRDGPLHALRAGHVLNCARRKRLGHVHHVPGRDEHVARGAGRARRLQVQQGLHGPQRGGGVRGVRGGDVQGCDWVGDLHQLLRGDVLCYYGADGVFRLHGLPDKLLERRWQDGGGGVLRDLLHNGRDRAEHAPRGGDKHAHGHARDKHQRPGGAEHRLLDHGAHGRRRLGHRAPLGGQRGQQRGGAVWQHSLL